MPNTATHEGQWEYELLVLDRPSDDDAIDGAISPEHLREIRSYGYDGWRVVSVQAGLQKVAGMPGERRPVIVVLFEKPRA